MSKKSIVIVCLWLFLFGAASGLAGQGQSGTADRPRPLDIQTKAAASGAGFWDDRFFAANGPVSALVVKDGILYAGGSFTVIGGIPAYYVAKWDGATWSALGSGLRSAVYALVFSGSDLYAASGASIYKWDGFVWTTIYSGFGGSIISLAFYGTDLYAVGVVHWKGSSWPSYFFIKWDGTTSSELGSGRLNDYYGTLAVSGTDLYVGGSFTMVAGISANSIAKWDGTHWASPDPSGIIGGVDALAVSGTDLYAAGSFTSAGGLPANHIAKWNGASWSALGTGTNGSISALAVSGTDLYAAGSFTSAGGIPANRVAKWNGTAWSALGSGIGGAVRALANDGTELFAGGEFTSAGGASIVNIAKWNNAAWSAVGRTGGLGIKGSTYALAISGADLFAGGYSMAGGAVSASDVIKWDGTSWSELGSGMNGSVHALAVSGANLYAGGLFSSVSGITANKIAKWDGTNWSALGSGISGSVSALAVSGANLYVGGSFTSAGGILANNIAKWDGTSWSAVGSGINGYVNALAVSGNNLYAGGGFGTAGGIMVNNIAKWNGTSWSAMGSGINGYVNALAVSGNVLFAGGDFATAGGIPAGKIAKWDGTSWSSLGPGMDGTVYALAISGNDLYAGGSFSSAGGTAANDIAKWNGTSWSTLGTGIGGLSTSYVFALAASEAILYAGGGFDTAGGLSSAGFAIWYWNLVLTSPVGNEVWEAGSVHPITWTAQPTVGDIKLEYSADGGASWTTIIGSTPNDGRYDWTVPGLPSAACLVRISENVGGGPVDTSETVFSIVSQPTIVLRSPNGGERWYGGSYYDIAWSSSLSGGNVRLEYSIDNGSSYTTIVASTANTGTYAWAVPSVVSATCLVRVSEAPSGSPSDASDVPFAIASLPPAISLNRKALYYGAIVGGVATRAQTIIVGNPGGGTLAWTAAPDQSWITVAPAAGTNSGQITIGVNTAGLAAGPRTGIVTISDANGLANPRTVSVILTVKDAGTSTAPLMQMTALAGGLYSGAIPVTGWAVDDIEIASVAIKRGPHGMDPPEAIGPDGLVFIGNATFVEGARPDIESAYSVYPMNYKGGWGYMLLTNFLPNQGYGPYDLYAVATDVEGNQTKTGPAWISCDNVHAVKPFGTIDTPAQGGEASGSLFVNFGWVLTPMPKTVPKDGSRIEVYVDSVKVGDLATAPNVYDQYRVDVATTFPGLNNSGGPVGAFYLDTTKYANGVHTIYWVATDDGGAADGIGSRYFSIVNTGTAEARARQSAADDQAALASFSRRDDILGLGMTLEPLFVRTGFDGGAEPQSLIPDSSGLYRVEIPEVNRLELELRNAGTISSGSSRPLRYRSYLVVGDELRPLPIGSTLDARSGRFSWAPGPGFLGSYDLLFLEAGPEGFVRSVKVRVEIVPQTR